MPASLKGGVKAAEKEWGHGPLPHGRTLDIVAYFSVFGNRLTGAAVLWYTDTHSKGVAGTQRGAARSTDWREYPSWPDLK